MLLVAECRLELLAKEEVSLNKLSRYAGRVPYVEGRGSAIVIIAGVQGSVDVSRMQVRGKTKSNEWTLDRERCC